MLKYLRLKQHFDAPAMQREIALLEADGWLKHYNTSHYNGNWTVLPLRSVQGSSSNIIAVHNSAGPAVNRFKDTPLLKACPTIEEALRFFACEKTSVRLMNLSAGSEIKEHRDHDMSFEEGEVRMHIPVSTNSEVEFLLDGQQVVMEEGSCWYMNLSLPHAVKNGGTKDRIHLVIDCKVNEWLQELFADPSLFQQHIAQENKQALKAEDKARMIEELRLMNTAVSLEMAARLENEAS